LQKSLNQLESFSGELDLRLGLLEVQQGQTDAAIKTWTNLSQRSPKESGLGETADVLTGLWSNPPRLLPNAQQLIQDNLDGWFRYRALLQLYQLGQREDAIATLQAEEQVLAQQALVKLASIVTIPSLAGLLGVGLLLLLVGQRLLKGKESLLAHNGDVAWSTPWSGEIVWQVFIVGFFLMGQILVPLAFSLLQIKPAGSNIRIQAFYVLGSYLVVAFGGLSVLYLSIKRFLPLPGGWFRFNLRGNWFWWGLGGYCVALPLVVVVSLINQKLWQGQGGSNPLLSLALEGRDQVALGIFFFTAVIAAPLFEEFLFRGFLLPSLTRYLPVSGAILLSSLLFAVAHLSLSEILPLTTLGIVLGVVYTRSRNLLAPMLVHSLWNSGTLFSCFS
jgi:membrane protease YdiL (CAAX protease family)